MNTTISLLPVLILISLAFLSSCTSATSDTIENISTLQTSTQIAPTTEAVVSSSNLESDGSTIMSSEVMTSKSITYSTDHGKHRVTATFIIIQGTDGSISDVTATMVSGDRESRQYINRFNSAAKSQIVGRKISSLSLSAVGGASDTTDAFIQVLGSL